MEELLKPENLRILIPVTIGFIAACIGFITAMSVAISSYLLGKRTEVNKIKLNKSYKLAEKIAKHVEKVERSYLYFEAFWKENYGHVSFDKGITNFNSKPTLFDEQYKSIQALSNDRHKLGVCLLGAWLYIPQDAVELVQDYIAVGNFSWKDDAAGLFDDYNERFFENLLHPKNKKEREKAYLKVKKRFSKLKL